MDKRLSFEKRLWLFLFALFLLLAVGVFLNVKYRPAPITTVENLIGQNGKDGQSIQGPQGPSGYSPVKGVDYFDGATGATGLTGVQGIQGEQGLQGVQGDTGAQGDPGTPGQNPEFRCNPKNHNYEWRYVGDDTWQVLQKNSQACYSAS